MGKAYDIKLVQTEILKIMKQLHIALIENNLKYYLYSESTESA